MTTENTQTATENAGEIDPLLRLPQVLQIIPVSRSGWWAGVASGKYPQGVKISERCRAWHASKIRKLSESFK
jgi:predicted DNA-binding transcriptional regulator AlpA